MGKYKILDKDLKKIRHKWEYDLYEENLESQKRIDKFYSEENLSENDMICRKYQLELYLNRRNVLFFPIIILLRLLKIDIFNSHIFQCILAFDAENSRILSLHISVIHA